MVIKNCTTANWIHKSFMKRKNGRRHDPITLVLSTSDIKMLNFYKNKLQFSARLPCALKIHTNWNKHTDIPELYRHYRTSLSPIIFVWSLFSVCISVSAPVALFL